MLRRRLPGTALVAALALSGCTGADTPSPGAGATAAESESQSGSESGSESPTVHRAATPPRPDEDACYRLSYDDALAPSLEAGPVPCRQRHSARTFHVGSLDVVESGHLLAVDSDRARDQVSRVCPRQFARYVGGSAEDRRLSMLTTSWFSPTLEQSDAGQAWFRCDVIATSAPRRLARLSGNLEDVLDTEAGRDRWGRCATGDPGDKAARHVLCSRRQARWRAVATVDVPAGPRGRFPGIRAAKEAGAECEDVARDLADDPLTFDWGWEWPTRKQWQGGRQHGFCWMPRQ